MDIRKLFQRRSIRTNFFWSILTVVLLTGIVIGTLINYAAKQLIQDEVRNRFISIADAGEGQIYNYLSFMKSRTTDFVSDGFIQDNLGKIEKNSPANANEPDHFNLHIEEKKKLDPDILAIIITDVNGKVVASTNENEMGKSKAEDKFFIEGSRGIYLDQLKDTDMHSDRSIIVSAPIYDHDSGNILGVMINSFSTGKLSSILSGQYQRDLGAKTSEMTRSQTMEIYLVDKDKRMLAVPSRLSDEALGGSSKVEVNSVPVNSCLKNKEEVFQIYKNYLNKEVVGASMCFPQYGWTLLVEMPTEVVFAPLKSLLLKIALLIALATFMVSVGSLIVSGKLIRSIGILSDGIRTISSGDLNHLVVVKTGDEIEMLADAFNAMVAKLKESYRGFDQKIKEQTDKITAQIAEVEKKNILMEDSKRAVLNLLEDEIELENKLKAEKAGVERKVEERSRELGEQKMRLLASVSSLTVGFIMTDESNNVITINQVAKNIMCGSEKQRLSLDHKCTLSDIEGELKSAIDLRALIDRSKKEQKSYIVKELPFRGKLLKILVTPTKNASEVIGCVVLIDDITEEKLVERSKDEFFSIASHELRTPLTAIRGNTSLIKQFYADKLQDKDLKEMIEDIHESSIRLIGIVNDFLNVSRLELRKMKFNKDEFDVEELAQNVVKEYVAIGAVKKLYLKVEKSPSPLPLVIADKDRIKEVLINLVGNSIKFTENGGITISFEPKQGYVKVMVKDTGRGVSETGRALLFRKFQQAGKSLFTRDAIHGTGLGLYISKMMIEGMGGQIGLESSEVGKGSVFAFFIPAKV